MSSRSGVRRAGGPSRPRPQTSPASPTRSRTSGRAPASDSPRRSTPQHVPVLLQASIEILQPRPGAVCFDGTFGGGGHAREILRRIQPGGLLLAMDRDPEASARARLLQQEFGRSLRFVEGDFADCGIQIAGLARGEAPLDGALLDLGLSSFQLQDPTRGFSFSTDGPLDMRFSPHQSTSAAEVVNRYPEERLRQVIFTLGQESWAGRIAAAIVRQRQKAPLLTTFALAELVRR